MFVFSNFLMAFATVVNVVLTIYMWIVIARALISWVSPNPYNPIVQFLHRTTEPVLWRVRRYLPTWGVGIDFSPLVVILILYFLKLFLVRTLIQIAYQWG